MYYPVDNVKKIKNKAVAIKEKSKWSRANQFKLAFFISLFFLSKHSLTADPE